MEVLELALKHFECDAKYSLTWGNGKNLVGSSQDDFINTFINRSYRHLTSISHLLHTTFSSQNVLDKQLRSKGLIGTVFSRCENDLENLKKEYVINFDASMEIDISFAYEDEEEILPTVLQTLVARSIVFQLNMIKTHIMEV